MGGGLVLSLRPSGLLMEQTRMAEGVGYLGWLNESAARLFLFRGIDVNKTIEWTIIDTLKVT